MQVQVPTWLGANVRHGIDNGYHDEPVPKHTRGITGREVLKFEMQRVPHGYDKSRMDPFEGCTESDGERGPEERSKQRAKRGRAVEEGGPPADDDTIRSIVAPDTGPTSFGPPVMDFDAGSLVSIDSLEALTELYKSLMADRGPGLAAGCAADILGHALTAQHRARERLQDEEKEAESSREERWRGSSGAALDRGSVEDVLATAKQRLRHGPIFPQNSGRWHVSANTTAL